MRILAIDPGMNGAWAFLSGIELCDAGELPTIGDGAQRRINAVEFQRDMKQFFPVTAVIEDVAARPGQGVSSMFRFGRAVGTIEGVLAANLVPIRRVTPTEWKRYFRLAGKAKGSGEPSRQKALERWPRAIEFFHLKKHSQRAEAALIGLWFAETQGRPGGTDGVGGATADLLKGSMAGR